MKPNWFMMTLIAGTLAVSQSAAGYTSIGSGAASCEAWVAARHAPNASETAMQQQWVVGFLSGIGSMVLGELDPLHGLDAAAVYGWVDRYCHDHPTETIEAAALVFIQEHPR
jgi:hypothetical protein